MESDFVYIGKIVRFQGNKGFVRIVEVVDNPGRLFSLTDIPIFVKEEVDSFKRLDLESVKPHKQFFIFKFRGIDSLGDAKMICGKEIYIRECDLWGLPKNEFYVDGLKGLRAVSDADGSLIGKVVDVIEASGDDLLIVSNGDTECMIPFNSFFVREIDSKNGFVKIHVIDGLMDFNKR